MSTLWLRSKPELAIVLTACSRMLPVPVCTTLGLQSLTMCSHHANPDLENNIPLLGGTQYAAAYVNVEAETMQPHTEPDTSYTMISVPAQPNVSYNEPAHASFNFYFEDSDTPHVSIPLRPGVSIFFQWLLVDASTG